MTIQDQQSTIQTSTESAAPVTASEAPAISSRETVSRRSTMIEAGAPELTRRVVVLVFGLIQAVIVLRIVLLLLDARTGNDLVAAILNISQVFVAPFEGILHTNALTSGGSVLDVAAVVAIIGWTLVELLVFAVINLFRRESTVSA